MDLLLETAEEEGLSTAAGDLFEGEGSGPLEVTEEIADFMEGFTVDDGNSEIEMSDLETTRDGTSQTGDIPTTGVGIPMGAAVLTEESPRKLSSQEKKLKSIRTKEWKEFNNGSEAPPTLLHASGLNDISGVRQTSIDIPLIRGFMQFCFDKGMKHSRMVTATDFLQNHLRDQHVHICLPNPKGLVRQDPKVKELLKAVLGNTAEAAIEDDTDVLGDVILSDVTVAQSIKFVTHCFNPCNSSRLAKIDMLSRIQLAAGHRETQMAGQRGENLVSQRLGFSFLHHYPNIGPPPGTYCDMTLTNKGKTNHVGRHDFTALGCHRNPILDAIGLHGICLLWRFAAINEPFPHCLKTSEIKQRPMFRSPQNHLEHMDGTTLYRIWKNANEDLEILTPKVTHQGRGQLNRELDVWGIPEPKICRHTNAATSNKTAGGLGEVSRKSYMITKPAETIVQACHGDWRRMREHDPAWGLSQQDPNGYRLILDQLIDSPFGVPDLMHSTVDYALEEAKTRKTHGEYVKKGLKNAIGYLQSMRSRLRRGLLLAAARPLDSNGQLVADGEPIYKLFKNCPVFTLPIFRTEEFLKLVEKVRAAQDGQASLEATLEQMREANSASHNWMNQMTTMMDRNHQQLLSRMDHLESCYQQTRPTPGTEIPTHQIDQQVNKEQTSQPNQLSESTESPQRVRIIPSRGGSTDVDSTLNAQGKKRKRRTATNRLDFVGTRYVQSDSNVFAKDFWQEYSIGRGGRRSLRYMEKNEPDWRRDAPGEKKFTQFFSERKKIYLYIALLISTGEEEESAVQKVQDIFDAPNNHSRNGKPRLNKVNKVLTERIRELGFSPKDNPADVELNGYPDNP